MLQNTIVKKRQEGFSIVEVMIVLAIAGLIILVVFLAVPALQRNSRNTTVRNSATNISGAIGEYRSANGGRNPTATGISLNTTNGTLTVGGGTGTNSVTATLDGSVTSIATSTTSGSGTPKTGEMRVIIGQKCSSPSSSTTTAAARSVAIVYAIETASGTAGQCIDA